MNVALLREQFPILTFQEQVVLAPYTYMKVGGPAEVYVELTNREDLFALCSLCFRRQIPFVVLGGVSNTLIPDRGLSGLVIRNLTSHISFQTPTGEQQLVTADSGVVTATLAHSTIQAGLTGLEPFVGVPGTIGGAVKNNSHFSAHDLIGDFIVSVDVCTSEGELATWPASTLAFAYDYSIFHKQPDVILAATFRLAKGDAVHMQEKVRAAALKRTQTQPIGLPSTGCMFQNPKVTSQQVERIAQLHTIPDTALKQLTDGSMQIAAGFLIDRAGLKGTTIGGAQVSDKHATYIVNLGHATAHDVEELATAVEAKVQEAFGVTLTREVFFL